MTNKVEFVRYVRGYRNNQVSNLHGITLVFEMDYDTELVAVSWSVCHETNFSRKEGTAVARKNAQKLYMTFTEAQEFSNITTSLFAFLKGQGYLNWHVDGDYFSLREALNKVNNTLLKFDCKGK
jgi:hypothetical protein